MNSFTIYIPTKKRSKSCYTAIELIENNVNFVLVVEKEDEEDYKQIFKDVEIIVLPDSNKGLSYARNFIKDYSISKNEKYHWQMDDDIKCFKKRENSKNVKESPLYIINEVENEIKRYSNVGVCGLRDSVFAWTQKEKISVNKLVASCYIINNDVDVKWSENMIEDVDYCLQVLEKNKCTIIFNYLLYEKKSNNSIKGGQQFFDYELLNINLVNKYPDILKLRLDKKNNIKKVAPSKVWNNYKQKPELL